ncbi:unnamed protein product [Echinostoma caproni]|uniref:AAA_12 domain-containing protein n=1 Tax=Echinostoma caproni TaxID=27848 RepID=A0A183AMR6_9TREM|nr:unnamed protein product [Echinostoma caproni]
MLIDECGQALEPECLIPINRNPSRLVLVGDQCQLGPVVLSQQALDAGFDLSLFERLQLLGVPLVRLEVSITIPILIINAIVLMSMHPELAKFSSRVFYDNRIQNGVSPSERSGVSRFRWPSPDKPTFFYLVRSQEQRASNGVSYLNPREAKAVKSIVQELISCGVDKNNIGVIAPYTGQKTYLTQYLGELANGPKEKVEVSSVDAYQGREKDYIILSCVRSNRNRTVGFLKDARRLNVALTRARFGLIVIGDPITLSTDPLWNDLLHFYHERDLLLEGQLDKLRPGVLNSPKPAVPYIYRKDISCLA